jgi:hypothetical protein
MRYPSVNVVPTSEAVRQSLRHPCGWGFEHSDAEGTPWPDDDFTKAHVASGDITLTYPTIARDDSARPAVRATGKT